MRQSCVLACVPCSDRDRLDRWHRQPKIGRATASAWRGPTDLCGRGGHVPSACRMPSARANAGSRSADRGMAEQRWLTGCRRWAWPSCPAGPVHRRDADLRKTRPGGVSILTQWVEVVDASAQQISRTLSAADGAHRPHQLSVRPGRLRESG